MNYFTPTQERIALVETASYNQKLLALRARRLAQQRMDYAHKIAKINKEIDDNEQDDDNEITTIYLGKAPKITEESDDEQYEIDEIFAPVPYQKGYWMAAQRQNQKMQKMQQQNNNNNTNNNINNIKQQNESQLPSLQKTGKTAGIQRSSSSMSSLHKTHPTRSQYQYSYNNNNNTNNNRSRSHHRNIHTPYQPNYSSQRKQPQYKPATQHHPSYKYQYQQQQLTQKSNTKPSGGPPALV